MFFVCFARGIKYTLIKYNLFKREAHRLAENIECMLWTLKSESS